MTANRQYLGLVGVERTDYLVVISHRTDRLLIYFLNYIAFLQLGRAAIWIDIRHHDAAHAVGQIELPRQRGR